MTLLLAGCGQTIKISWEDPSVAIQKGTLLRHEGAEVGQVTGVRNTGGVFTAEVHIDKSAAAQLKSGSAFLVRQPDGGQPVYVDIVTVRADSTPLADGAMYKISQNEKIVSGQVILDDVMSNWKNYAAPIAAVLVLFILLLVCLKKLGHLIAFLVCVAAGVGGAYFIPPYIASYVQQWVPEQFHPDWVAKGIGFLAAFIVARIITRIIGPSHKHSD